MISRYIRQAWFLLLASLAWPAVGVEVSSQRAQVLLFPLYHAAPDRNTLIAIENRDSMAKAVLIRLREQRNGRPVLTFNLYLAPHDLWTAALALNPATGEPQLITSDASCTVPAIFHSPSLAGRVTLRNYEYGFGNSDGGPQDLTRARVGFVEVIDLGSLDPFGSVSPQVIQQSANSCAAVVARLMPGGQWFTDPLAGFLPPRGRLSGFATLIDVAAGTSWAIPVTPLAGFRDRPGHASPSQGLTLADASGPDPDWVEAWVQTSAGRVRFEYPRTRAIDAVSAVLMAESLSAPYTTDAAVAAQSEVVLSFPTKWAYTDQVLNPTEATPPFRSLFQRNAARYTVNSRIADDDRIWLRSSCEMSVEVIWHCDDIGFLPPPSPPLPRLSGSITSISLNASGPVPSAMTPEYRLPDRSDIPERGRITISLQQPIDLPTAPPYEMRPDRQGRILKGLPVVGVHLQSARYTNASPHWLGSYGIASEMQRSDQSP